MAIRDDDLAGVFARLRGRLTGKAVNMLGNRADAEDAVSDAYVRVWTSRHRIRGSDLNTAERLVTVAVTNTCLNVSTARKRRPPQDEQFDIDQVADDYRLPVLEMVIILDEYRWVRGAMAALPDAANRRAIHLALVDGHTYATIAGLEGCSLQMVKSRIHRARVALRDALAPPDRLSESMEDRP